MLLAFSIRCLSGKFRCEAEIDPEDSVDTLSLIGKDRGRDEEDNVSDFKHHFTNH